VRGSGWGGEGGGGVFNDEWRKGWWRGEGSWDNVANKTREQKNKKKEKKKKKTKQKSREKKVLRNKKDTENAEDRMRRDAVEKKKQEVREGKRKRISSQIQLVNNRYPK